MMKEIKCLIIDDDDEDRWIFDIALKDVGLPYQLRAFNSGINALNELNTEEIMPDYIFLDLNMPLLSGSECLKKIRKIPKLRKVPVIIYSTSSLYDHVQESKESGATNFMTKPADIKKLTKILKNIFTCVKLPFKLN